MTSRAVPYHHRPLRDGDHTVPAVDVRRRAAVVRERPGRYDDQAGDGPDRASMPPKPPHPADAPDADEHAAALPDAAVTDDAAHGPGLSGAVSQVRAAIDGLLHEATEPGTAGGELTALLGLLTALDVGHAAAVELTDRALRRNSAQRSAGLPLEGLLAMESRHTYSDRTALLEVTRIVRGMPNLRRAWQAGRLGWGQVRTITREAATLNATSRAELDARLADPDRWSRWDPDRLCDTVRELTASLRPPKAERDRELARIEQRFHHVQPRLDGSLSGYYELDSEAAAVWLEALDHAAPAPTRANDHTRDSLDATDHDDETTDGDGDGCGGGTPAFADRVGNRTRARQRADGMVLLAEAWLAGSRPDGTPRRARTRTLVWTDLDRLTGTDTSARAARMLWATIGAPVTLTAESASRLASDTDLQFIIHRDGQVVGVSDPTPTIPAKARAAVHARDQGCRFPGCSVPIQWTDLHHVIAREDGGPTTVSNLVALCRRHHTAVTNRAWQLDMAPDGTVTVRRGRRIATSDPPHRRTLPAPSTRPPPRPSEVTVLSGDDTP